MMNNELDIHNTTEDIVFSKLQAIFDEIQRSGNPDGFCMCEQCRVDIICYALNRIEPNYIVSNRGLTRMEQTGVKHQQIGADVATLLYKGIRLVNHNLRPTAPHDGSHTEKPKINSPVFDIPTISGRIFDGISFEPIVNIEVALLSQGELVPARNSNWQNPYTIIPITPGIFSFWPAPVITAESDIRRDFNYSIRINSPDYEVLNHFFTITSISRFLGTNSQTLNRSYKLPDLYLFPPGEAEQNG
ncbi:MAG: late competence development ComFB family protein [Treponema sp.]|jgi:competence protein ComFB|nr:late competence development ComFB family protein [Treponema sp.]